MKHHKRLSIVCLFTAVWGLSACTAVVAPPAVPSDFTADAQVAFGDFSYTCTVQREADCVTVTVNDTAAAGLTVICDGDTVTFMQREITKRFPKENMDITNPARVLWEVFDDVCGGSAEASQEDALTVYSGSCSAGLFTLSQNADGSWNTLSVPAAGLTFIFI